MRRSARNACHLVCVTLLRVERCASLAPSNRLACRDLQAAPLQELALCEHKSASVRRRRQVWPVAKTSLAKSRVRTLVMAAREREREREKTQTFGVNFI